MDTRSDTEWQAALAPEAYQTLRKGLMEPPGAGRYVAETAVGIYRCRGCGTPLFSSDQKVDMGAGYATFTAPLDPERVSTVTHYNEAGEPFLACTCTTCGGQVGLIDALSLRSAADLEQGTTERYFHVSSNAVVFKKALTVKNYPFGALGMILALSVFVYVGWNWSQTLVSVSKLESTQGTIPLWVGDTQIDATVVRLDQPNASTSGMLVREGGALLVALPVDGSTPAIKFANHSVDILFLDENFKVLAWERERASQTSRPLSRPERARFMLMAQPGALSNQIFATGAEVIVTNRASLL